MDEHHDDVRFEQVSPKGVSRAVPILTFVIGIFLGAAVVKPWDLLFPPASTPIDRGPVGVAVASATPKEVPTPSPDRGPAECAFAGGWRIFALGQRDRLGGDGSTTGGAEPSAGGAFSDIGNPLRRWLEIAPLSSVSGPGDARIPFVTIVSDRITGVGYCPPPGSSDRPPAAAILEAWSVDGTGAADTLPLQSAPPQGSITTELEVYIGARDGTDGRWAPGRYVFAVAAASEGYSRWFGLEIRTPPGRPTS